MSRAAEVEHLPERSREAPPPTAPSEPAAATGAGPRRMWTVIRIAVLVLVLAAIAVWASQWVRDSLLYVHETDARIKADMIEVSSRVGGLISEFAGAEGDPAPPGHVIARLDDRDASLRLKELAAERAALEAEARRLDAEITMVDDMSGSRLRSERSRVAAARALVESFDYQHKFAEAEFRRAEKLRAKGVTSARALEEARTAWLTAQQELLRARAQVATAESELGEASAARREIAVLQERRLQLEHRLAEVDVRIDRQRTDISDRIIVSPINGLISRTFAAIGEYVQPGQRIAQVYNPDDVWIEANIRETDVGRVQLGQVVEFTVDAYPDESFQGVVTRIGYAATSQFSLLPTNNPSGSFTKITQRLPVKIALSGIDHRLRPGMMVEVNIRVGEPD